MTLHLLVKLTSPPYPVFWDPVSWPRARVCLNRCVGICSVEMCEWWYLKKDKKEKHTFHQWVSPRKTTKAIKPPSYLEFFNVKRESGANIANLHFHVSTFCRKKIHNGNNDSYCKIALNSLHIYPLMWRQWRSLCFWSKLMPPIFSLLWNISKNLNLET